MSERLCAEYSVHYEETSLQDRREDDTSRSQELGVAVIDPSSQQTASSDVNLNRASTPHFCEPGVTSFIDLRGHSESFHSHNDDSEDNNNDVLCFLTRSRQKDENLNRVPFESKSGFSSQSMDEFILATPDEVFNDASTESHRASRNCALLSNSKAHETHILSPLVYKSHNYKNNGNEEAFVRLPSFSTRQTNAEATVSETRKRDHIEIEDTSEDEDNEELSQIFDRISSNQRLSALRTSYRVMPRKANHLEPLYWSSNV